MGSRERKRRLKKKKAIKKQRYTHSPGPNQPRVQSHLRIQREGGRERERLRFLTGIVMNVFRAVDADRQISYLIPAHLSSHSMQPPTLMYCPPPQNSGFPSMFHVYHSDAGIGGRGGLRTVRVAPQKRMPAI